MFWKLGIGLILLVVADLAAVYSIIRLWERDR